MIQVKVFRENAINGLEWDINHFFRKNPEVELIDIKFQNAIAETKYGFEERCAAMVIYKETEK
ncbi:sporulation protein Cse60 [uncultured Streptococcus sp.]|jgi:hypothetical protein|uniref:Sporulation protein Cse60 n=2 Tax=unclassified Caudoviricetes TaxID=2788787 RepID=A0A8S5QD45_9CAUD|nr:sporulation protein Cse60 [uncultured Streptococcus sp.]DAE06294.1 MAG TPA: Sporulation protein Cse60 [Siphoviridae sp. ctQWG7]DAE16721.1 MAG TPA: Sporulation protein Cse60 [Siphoviridae sp. ct8Hy2]